MGQRFTNPQPVAQTRLMRQYPAFLTASPEDIVQEPSASPEGDRIRPALRILKRKVLSHQRVNLALGLARIGAGARP
jgi:hypothetical protein